MFLEVKEFVLHVYRMQGSEVVLEGKGGGFPSGRFLQSWNHCFNILDMEAGLMGSYLKIVESELERPDSLPLYPWKVAGSRLSFGPHLCF